MLDTLSETEACDMLARLFKSRGYTIKRNFTFREYGVEFHVDGWDAKARVGFEFMTSEDDDHDDLSLEEYQTLSAAQQRGELSLFILDEVEPISAADLTEMANEFLDEVAAAGKARRRPARRASAAKTAAARKTSAARKTASATKRAAKRPAARKTKKAKKAKAVKKPKKPSRTKRPKRS